MTQGDDLNLGWISLSGHGNNSILSFLVICVHCSLSGVLVKRGGFGKHKPQVWSGPSPCYDKDGVMKFVSLVTNKKQNEVLLGKFGVKRNRFCKVKNKF